MADKTIGSMAAVIRATAGQFDADLKQAGKSVDRFKSHVEASAPKGGFMDAFGMGAGIGAGIAAIQAAIQSVGATFSKVFDTINQGEATADLAAQLGATTEELSSLRYAAEISGSSASVMDAALEKLNQKLGEARLGSSETAASFRALGLDTGKLSKMPLGERVKTIADAFKELNDPTKQAAYAVDIFGKQGVRLVNVLREGRIGIEALQAKAEHFNATLSTDQANALSKGADAVDNLKLAWQGLWNQLSVKVIPVIIHLAENLAEFVAVISRAVEGLSTFQVKVALAVATIAIAIPVAIKVVSVILSVAKAFQIAAKAAAVFQLFTGPSGWAKVGIGLAATIGTVALLNSAFDDTGKAASEAADATNNIAAAVDNVAVAKKSLGETPGVGSALRGSAAAASAAFSSQRLQGDVSTQKAANSIAKEQLAVQKQIRDALKPGSTAAATRTVDI